MSSTWYFDITSSAYYLELLFTLLGQLLILDNLGVCTHRHLLSSRIFQVYPQHQGLFCQWGCTATCAEHSSLFYLYLHSELGLWPLLCLVTNSDMAWGTA